MTERFVELAGIANEQVVAALGAELQVAQDFALGVGAQLHIAGGKAALEVYPAARVARVTTDRARIELRQLPGAFAVDPDKNRIIFEQGDAEDRTRLIVQHDGNVSYHPVRRATISSVTKPEATTDAQVTTSTQVPAEVPPAPQTRSVEDGETEPITIQGRLGRDPWFSDGEDSPRGGFPLAVNTDNQTTWHRVVVFDDTAVALKEQAQRGDIRKGRLVDATGRHVTREEETARGTKRPATEFHATHVTRVRATPRPR